MFTLSRAGPGALRLRRLHVILPTTYPTNCGRTLGLELRGTDGSTGPGAGLLNPGWWGGDFLIANLTMGDYLHIKKILHYFGKVNMFGAVYRKFQ